MNAIPVGSGEANSSDLTVGDAGLVSVYIIGLSGGSVIQGATFLISIKGTDGQYTNIGGLSAAESAKNVQLAAGTVIRVTRVANGVTAGVDATGVS